MKRGIIALVSLFYLGAMVFGVVSSELFAAPSGVGRDVVNINGANYTVYIVQKGDTLYSLARNNNISYSELIENNPSLKSGLKEGQSIKIPYKGEVDDAAQERRENRDMSERKLRKVFDLHEVKPKETLYSISKMYEISVATLLADNPDVTPSNITVGTELKIRKDEQGSIDVKAEQRDMMESVGAVAVVEPVEIESTPEEAIDSHEGDSVVRDRQVVEPAHFMALGERDTLRIALLLPLSVKGRVMRPFVEFYSGFLLGVEDLKRAGYCVDVALFNSERTLSRLSEIVKSDMLYRSCNLIVGPVYEELLPAVLADAESRSVPVVSPLASIKSLDSPVLFQMAPSESHRYDKLAEMLPIKSAEEYEREQDALALDEADLAADAIFIDEPQYDTLRDGSVVMVNARPEPEPVRQVTLIYGDNIDTLYARKLREDLTFRGVEFVTREYNYLHSTVIAERRKDIEQQIEQMREESEFVGDTLDSLFIVRYRDSLSRDFEKSDLSTLVSNGAKDNIFFILADNEVAVDRTLSALASAYTAQWDRSRGENGQRIKSYIPSPYVVVANPDWSRYKNIDRTVYFRNKVIDFPTYVAGRDRANIREFDSRYSAAFSSMPSLYSYRGYDVAHLFGFGMYGDIEVGLEGRQYKPLQSGYLFERDGESARRINTNWMRVEYNQNFTLTIE